MLDVMRHVNQERATGADAPRRRQRLRERKMGRVARRPQAVEDQRVDALEQRPGFVGDQVRVGAIGQVSETKPEHVKHTVPQPQRNHLHPEQLEGLRGDPRKLDLRHSATRHRQRLEGIVEGPADPPFHSLLAKRGDRPAGLKTDRPDVVETVDVVDVVVCVEDRVDPADPFPQELATEVGGRVDEERAAGQAEHDAGPRAAVPRVVAAACATAAAHHGHADTRARAQEQELTGEIANVSHACRCRRFSKNSARRIGPFQVHRV